MQIRAWSKEYVSGIHEIDLHHRKLFDIINSFALENDENVTQACLLAFIDELWAYCKYHFALEEKMMQLNEYPLLQHHIDLHKNLEYIVSATKKEISLGKLKTPYTSVIRLSADWLNDHIALHDLAFFSFYRNKDYNLSDNMMGKPCEISTLNNEIVGVGRIETIHKNNIEISHTTGRSMPIDLNDIVKVSSTGKSSFQTCIAMVFYSSPDIVRLFNATVLKTSNNREFFRVKVDLECVLWVDSKPAYAKFVDLSVVGVMIAANETLEVSQSVRLEFLLQNSHFIEHCRVVRSIRRVDAPHNYGLAFESMESSQSDKLASYLFNKQTLIMHGLK